MGRFSKNLSKRGRKFLKDAYKKKDEKSAAKSTEKESKGKGWLNSAFGRKTAAASKSVADARKADKEESKTKQEKSASKKESRRSRIKRQILGRGGRKGRRRGRRRS